MNNKLVWDDDPRYDQPPRNVPCRPRFLDGVASFAPDWWRLCNRNFVAVMRREYPNLEIQGNFNGPYDDPNA